MYDTHSFTNYQAEKKNNKRIKLFLKGTYISNQSVGPVSG